MTTYYATYRLPSGGWQTAATFADRTEAEEAMEFHAQGRGYVIAENEEELEAKKQAI